VLNSKRRRTKNMFGLTVIQRLNRRGARTYGLSAALAALVFLSALPAPAPAQDSSPNTFRGGVTVHVGSVGLAPRQTLRITLPPSPLFQDGSVRFIRHSIKVYDRTLRLLYKADVEPGHEIGHLQSARHDHLPAEGEPGTRRVQTWIEVESWSLSPPSGQIDEPEPVLLQPTFEVVDDESGRTTVHGTLAKVGAGRLVLEGRNTY